MLLLKIFIGLSALFLAIFGLFRCKTGLDCFRYLPKNAQKNNWICKWTEQEAEQTLNFICHAQEKKEKKPLSFQFEYKGQRKDLEKIKNISVKMYERQGEQRGQEIRFAKSFVLFENKDTYYLNMPMGKENYAGNWHELVYKRQDYADTSVHYFYFYLLWDENLKFETLPSEVELAITVESVEGKKEFSLTIQKTEMECGKKVRTNPFG